MTPRKKYRQPSPNISEEDFQQQLIDLAHAFGWQVAHFRGVRVQRKDGTVYYQTPVQADGAGWPDLVLAKPDKPLVIAEVKSETGKVSPEQQVWLELLSRCQGVEAYTWKPSDYEEAKEVLGR